MKSDKQLDSIADVQERARLNNPVFELGATFGDYRVVKCLCAGLLAHYYQMQHVRDHRTLTIGVFHPRANGEEKFIKRLEALKKITAGFEHEAIPKILSCATIEERTCLFLEPVDGQSLSQYFEVHAEPGRSGVGIAASTRLIAQLLGALGCAHARGVDHRDLDSDLIFIREGGSLQILGVGVKAAMGIGLFESIVSASVSPLRADKEPRHLSSFDVMSPEYRSGVEEDSRVDIYAVGVIGYWLLVGRKPETAKYQNPTEFVDGLLPNWNTFFENSLVRNKEKRFQSCKMALVGLKKTEVALTSEGAGQIQRQIDRIPVPRGILERGPLAIRVYRLILIGLIGVSLTAVAAILLIKSFPGLSWDAERPGESTEPVVVVEQELAPTLADITVRSQPGAGVFLVDADGVAELLGETDANGLLSLAEAIAPGDHTIHVEKEGYVTQTVPVLGIEAGTSVEVEIALHLEPVEAALLTEPEGAQVRLDGVEVGRTPLRLERLKPGQSYQIEVQKPGYRSVERLVVPEAGEVLQLDFGALEPLSGSVRLEVTVAGLTGELTDELRRELKLRINGAVEPFPTKELEALPVGPTTFQLEHPLYDSEAVEIDIEDGGLHRVSFELMPRLAVVDLAIPEGLAYSLLVDNEPVDLDANDRVDVPAGRALALELRMKDHLTMRRQVELEPSERFLWDVEPVPIPGPEMGRSWEVPYVGIDFGWVPPGEFSMGSPSSEHARLPEEGPQADVRFTRGFWVGVYEVTQQQFAALAQSEPSQFRGPNRPVESISWEQAKAFCAQLTRIERDARRLPETYVYRLPTEAEWAYAARAGTTTPFHWGSEADASLGQFNGVYPIDRSDGLRSPKGGYGTTAVGQYAPNAFGLFDMHGNVREWTLDGFRSRLPGGTLVDPAPQPVDGRVAVRGGGWEDTAARVRSAAREQATADRVSNALGFRVVLAPELR
jgi:formylglycine-generating enzyme required for sulfatase activity